MPLKYYLKRSHTGAVSIERWVQVRKNSFSILWKNACIWFWQLFDIFYVSHHCVLKSCCFFLFFFLMPFVIESHPFHFYYFIFFLERKKKLRLYTYSMGGPTPIESLLLPQYKMIMLRPTECLRYLFCFSVGYVFLCFFFRHYINLCEWTELLINEHQVSKALLLLIPNTLCRV